VSYQYLDRKYHIFTEGFAQKKLLWSACSQATRTKAKEPKMEGRAFLASSHEATTLNGFKCSWLGTVENTFNSASLRRRIWHFLQCLPPEHWQTFKVVASWPDTKNTRPSLLGSFVCFSSLEHMQNIIVSFERELQWKCDIFYLVLMPHYMRQNI